MGMIVCQVGFNCPDFMRGTVCYFLNARCGRSARRVLS